MIFAVLGTTFVREGKADTLRIFDPARDRIVSLWLAANWADNQAALHPAISVQDVAAAPPAPPEGERNVSAHLEVVDGILEWIVETEAIPEEQISIERIYARLALARFFGSEIVTITAQSSGNLTGFVPPPNPTLLNVADYIADSLATVMGLSGAANLRAAAEARQRWLHEPVFTSESEEVRSLLELAGFTTTPRQRALLRLAQSIAARDGAHAALKTAVLETFT